MFFPLVDFVVFELRFLRDGLARVSIASNMTSKSCSMASICRMAGAYVFPRRRLRVLSRIGFNFSVIFVSKSPRDMWLERRPLVISARIHRSVVAAYASVIMASVAIVRFSDIMAAVAIVLLSWARFAYGQQNASCGFDGAATVSGRCQGGVITVTPT